MIPDGVGQEILSHYCHIHCMTSCNNFLSTSPSVNNEVNDKGFLGIVYHVSTFLIAEKNKEAQQKRNRPTSTLGALQLPLYPPASPISILPWCLSLAPFCYLNIMLANVALGATDKKFAETTVIFVPHHIVPLETSPLVSDGACHRSCRNRKSHSEWNRVQAHPCIMRNTLYSKGKNLLIQVILQGSQLVFPRALPQM